MIYMKNEETGEVRQYPGKAAPLMKGWKFVNYVNDQPSVHQQMTARLAVYATRHGIPVATFLDAARWLLDKDCPFCGIATKVLRQIDKLGEDLANDLIARILAAKERNDMETLETIRRNLWFSEQPESPQQS